jgi:PAS domain S-box-containing protein
MKPSLVRQINFGLGVTLLVLSLNSVISYRNILGLIENEKSVSRSHQTIAELEATLSILKDAETGQQGYLLTGKDHYLKPYQSAIAQINQQFQTLQRIPEGSIEQQQIRTLEQTILTKLAELEQTIQIRRTKGFDAALEIVRSDRGKQIMDEIRQQIRTLKTQERQKLQQQAKESEQSFNSTLVTFTVVMGASLLLLGGTTQLFRRNEKQRRQAEFDLRERESRLQLFVKYAPVSVAMFDTEMRYISVSQRWVDAYQLDSIESVVGKAHYDLFPNLPERWKAAHRRGLAGQNEKCDDDFYSLPDGSQQFLRWEVQPWRDQSSTVRGILLFVEDVTVRKQIDADLRASEEQFKVTFNQAAVGIAHVAPDGAWLRVNQKLCEIVGYNREELLQCTFQEITHPDDLESDLAFVQQMLANQIQTYSMDKRYIHKDQSVVWIHLTISLVRELDQQPKYFISVVQDISDLKRLEIERQQAETALAQSEERFRSAMEFSEIGTWDWNMLTNQVTWNDNHFRLLGYRPHCCDPSYDVWRDRVHPEDIEATEQAIQRAIATQSLYISDHRVIWEDDSTHWITARGQAVYNECGIPIRLLGVIIDITERKQAEIALQQLNETLEQRINDRTVQLTEINQELEAFTYTVSHDLRAPLRGMKGFAQALQEDYGDQIDEIAQTYLQNISDCAVQMNALISDLLSYSRLSNTQIQCSPVDLNDVIQTALQQLSNPIQAQQAMIHIPKTLPTVIAHRSILIQVVVNLISNSIKFVAPETQPIVEISTRIEKDRVYLSFRDYGIGIASKYHDRIFGVFERLHGSNAFSGTGIGLAIVRRGMERMGGSVGLESELGQGSHFWIALPLALNTTKLPNLSTSDFTYQVKNNSDIVSTREINHDIS